MAKLSEIFQSKWLNSGSFPPGERVVLTIKAVKRMTASADFHGDGSADNAEVKQTWAISFYETPKLYELKPTRAQTIAEVLGSDDTDQWIDKRIAIFVGKVQFGNERVPSLMVDSVPPPALPQPFGAVRESAIVPTKRFIPKENVDRWAAAVKAKGKVFEDFLKWLKNENAQAMAIAFGVGLDELDVCLVPFLKRYLDVIHEPPAIAAQRSEPGEDLDHVQEFVPTPPTLRTTSFPGAGKRPTPTEIRQAIENPDDIPF